MRCWAIGLAAVTSAAALFGGACGPSDDGARPSIDAGPDIAVPDGTSPPPTSDGGPPPPTSQGPPDPSAAARAALFIASCISDDGVNRTLQQLYLSRTTLPFRSPAVVACLAGKANGCGAIAECLGVSYTQSGPCDAGCAGSVYSECSGSGVRLEIDCARMGLDCKPIGGAYCGRPEEVACDESTFQGSCDDGVPVGCEDGLTRRGLHCPTFNATCTQLSTTSPSGIKVGCRGELGACTGTNNDDTTTANWEGERCEGGKLVGCLSDGLATLDCATSAVGFSCFEAQDAGPGGATAYCGNAAECTPQSPWEKIPATCDGTSVVMCNGGKVDKIDCLTLGFTGCAAGVCTPSGL